MTGSGKYLQDTFFFTKDILEVFMKRFFAFIFAVVFISAVLSAQSIGIGTRGTFGLGLGSAFSGDTVDDFNIDGVDVFRSFLFGGSLVGKVSFGSGLFVQPEVGFMRNQIGYRWSDSDRYDYSLGVTANRTEIRYESSGSVGYDSIEVPVIVGYDLYLTDGFFLSPFAGANVSFPFDSISWTCGDVTRTVTTYADGKETGNQSYSSPDGNDGMLMNVKSGFVPGVLVGAGFGYSFGSSVIAGDFRYLFDFSPLQGEWKFRGNNNTVHVLRRRGVNFGLSYLYFF